MNGRQSGGYFFSNEIKKIHAWPGPRSVAKGGRRKHWEAPMRDQFAKMSFVQQKSFVLFLSSHSLPLRLVVSPLPTHLDIVPLLPATLTSAHPPTIISSHHHLLWPSSLFRWMRRLLAVHGHLPALRRPGRDYLTTHHMPWMGMYPFQVPFHSVGERVACTG
jgi:hypothetical protein